MISVVVAVVGGCSPLDPRDSKPIATSTEFPVAATPTPSSAVPPVEAYPPGCDTVPGDGLCVKTVGDGVLHEGCRLTDVHDRLARLADAFNQGDAEAFSSFFPREGSEGDSGSVTELHWFSVSAWDGVESETIYEPEAIAEFVTRRHGQAERWEFQEIVVRQNAPRNATGITISLIRSADDLSERLVAGKAQINCETGLIVVWATGDA